MVEFDFWKVIPGRGPGLPSPTLTTAQVRAIDVVLQEHAPELATVWREAIGLAGPWMGPTQAAAEAESRFGREPVVPRSPTREERDL
jgi:hypothetical protein